MAESRDVCYGNKGMKGTILGKGEGKETCFEKKKLKIPPSEYKFLIR